MDSAKSGGGEVRKRRNKEKKRRSAHELKKKTKKQSDCGKGEMMHVEIIEDPMPVGDAIESDDVKNLKRYSAFQYDGYLFHLEDSVLISPEKENTKPAVAIIKGISEAQDGSMSVTVQWFYRPEELLDTGATENWSSFDDRELLFTNHMDEVPAKTIMHKCVVHFLPDWKMVPERKVHPGFVVQYFYDRSRQEVYKLTDRVYAESLQKEIDMRMKTTQLRIGVDDGK